VHSLPRVKQYHTVVPIFQCAGPLGVIAQNFARARAPVPQIPWQPSDFTDLLPTGSIARFGEQSHTSDIHIPAGEPTSFSKPIGSPVGWKAIRDGALYLMLQNRVYRGEIVHKEQSYPGEHMPIIDQYDRYRILLF
jgi:hypothetical protein